MKKAPTQKKTVFSVGQVATIAAAAASFAAIATALLAAHLFSSSFVSFQITPYDPTASSIVARRNQRVGWTQSYSVETGASNRVPRSTHDDDSASPKIVWLMSFPNSGTSFTLHLAREASSCSTATNYALEGEIKDKPGVPVVSTPEGVDGPWLNLIPNKTLSLPKFILTKTHCGGYCNYCPMDRYIETTRSFRMACQSGSKAIETTRGVLRKKLVTYHMKPAKALHIIRHPLDNVVARFHLDHRRQARMEMSNPNTTWPEIFPRNRTGFHQWCAFMDSNTADMMSSRWIDTRLRRLLSGVPCRGEFFRYTNWHNHAFEVTRDMDIPTLVLHYHEYRDSFERTVEKILNFLEQPYVGKGVEFVAGKEYHDYYSAKQKQSIYDLLRELSSRETWDHLKDYYFGNINDEYTSLMHDI